MRRAGFAALSLLALSVGPAEAQEFVLLARAQRPGTITRKQVRDLFTGRAKLWPNARVVQVVVPEAGTPELRWLAQFVFGESDDALLARIKQQVFRGELSAPATATSSDDCLEIARKSTGAVCVAQEKEAESVPPGVAMLHVAE